MFEQGLVDEVKNLLNSGFREGVTAPQAIGYKEIVAAFDGKCSFDEAREAIKLATRRYGKRQRTWFRKEKRINWLEGTLGSEALISQSKALIGLTLTQSENIHG